jgi:pSer/pThr/pTyr-binding forkhead associated (FHA) protein
MDETIVCENCGYENPEGALLCRRCYRLLVRDGKLQTDILDSSVNAKGTTEHEPVDLNDIDDDSRPFKSTLRLKVEKTGHELTRTFQASTMLIGRADPTRNINPDIDLNPHGAYAQGVSRTHALLRREHQRILIQDLNSANYTYLNGKRLVPNIPYPLRHGDHLRVGRLRLRVAFD